MPKTIISSPIVGQEIVFILENGFTAPATVTQEITNESGSGAIVKWPSGQGAVIYWKDESKKWQYA